MPGAVPVPVVTAPWVRTLWWQGNRIDISAAVSARYLYFATETRVVVNGRPVAWSGGFGMEEWATGVFRGVGGEDHRIAVRAKVLHGRVASLDGLVWIDGVLVERCILPVRWGRESVVGSMTGTIIVLTTAMTLLGWLFGIG